MVRMQVLQWILVSAYMYVYSGVGMYNFLGLQYLIQANNLMETHFWLVYNVIITSENIQLLRLWMAHGIHLLYSDIIYTNM